MLASREGYVDAEQRVSIAAGEAKSVSLQLEESKSVLSAWWLWTTIGVAVAGGTAAAIVLATRPAAIYCIGRASGVDCD